MARVQDTTLETLRRELVGQEVMGIRILAVGVRPSAVWDSEELVMQLTVTDPDGDTWGQEITSALRRRARAAAALFDDDPARYIVLLESEHPDYGADWPRAIP